MTIFRSIAKVYGAATTLFQNKSNGFRTDDSQAAQKLVIFTSGEPDSLKIVEEERKLFDKEVRHLNQRLFKTFPGQKQIKWFSNWKQNFKKISRNN